MSCPSASRVNLMTMILNCKDHDNYRVNLESISISSWSAGVGGMQAERQLKDDKMIFSIITMVVTFNIINNMNISNKIHTYISWASKRRSWARVLQIPQDQCFQDPTRLWSGSSVPHRLGPLVSVGSPRPQLCNAVERFRRALSRPRASKSNQANINLWNYTWTGWGWPSFMRWLSMEGTVARSSSGSSSSAPSLLVYLAASLRLNKLECL